MSDRITNGSGILLAFFTFSCLFTESHGAFDGDGGVFAVESFDIFNIKIEDSSFELFIVNNTLFASCRSCEEIFSSPQGSLEVTTDFDCAVNATIGFIRKGVEVSLAVVNLNSICTGCLIGILKHVSIILELKIPGLKFNSIYEVNIDSNGVVFVEDPIGFDLNSTSIGALCCECANGKAAHKHYSNNSGKQFLCNFHFCDLPFSKSFFILRAELRNPKYLNIA